MCVSGCEVISTVLRADPKGAAQDLQHRRVPEGSSGRGGQQNLGHQGRHGAGQVAAEGTGLLQDTGPAQPETPADGHVGGGPRLLR